MKKKDKVKKVIEDLEIGESLIKEGFIKETWGVSNYFTQVCFNTQFSNAKKKLIGRDFKSVKGIITRLK